MNKKSLFLISFCLFFLSFYLIDSLINSDSEVESNIAKYDQRINRYFYVFVYIGSSTCVYSNNELLPTAIKNFQSELKLETQRKEFSYTSIGISIDWDIENGISHLKKQGDFDEIIVGNSWYNHGASKFIFEDSLAVPATPQVLVLKRIYKQSDVYPENYSTIIEDEILVHHKMGLDSIINWNDDF